MKLIITLSIALLLTSCAFLKENVTGIAGGAAAIAVAPAAQSAIAQCVANDAQAQTALQAPSLFFERGYDVITELGADTPILELIENSPDYWAAVPEQWAQVWAVLDGRDCGPVVAQFRVNAEAAFQVAKKVEAQKSRIQTACQIYAAYGPIASIFSPITLPSRVPGCS